MAGELSTRSVNRPDLEILMATYSVGYFVGSLATKSINRLLARALVKLAPSELQLTEISFSGSR